MSKKYGCAIWNFFDDQLRGQGDKNIQMSVGILKNKLKRFFQKTFVIYLTNWFHTFSPYMYINIISWVSSILTLICMYLYTLYILWCLYDWIIKTTTTNLLFMIGTGKVHCNRCIDRIVHYNHIHYKRCWLYISPN